jgi:hypothetical protein
MLDGPTLQSARGFFTQPTFRLKGGEFFLVFFLGRTKVGNRTEQYVLKGEKKKDLFFTLMKVPTHKPMAQKIEGTISSKYGQPFHVYMHIISYDTIMKRYHFWLRLINSLKN